MSWRRRVQVEGCEYEEGGHRGRGKEVCGSGAGNGDGGWRLAVKWTKRGDACVGAATGGCECGCGCVGAVRVDSLSSEEGGGGR